MKTATLVKLTVLGKQPDKKTTLSTLQQLGLLHISQAKSKETTFIKDTVEEELDEISKQLLELNYIADQTALDLQYTLQELPSYKETATQAQQFITSYLPLIKKYAQEQKKRKEQQELINARIALLQNLPFALSPTPTASTTLLYTADKSIFFPKIRKQIRFVLKKTKHQNKTFYYEFIVKKANAKKLEEKLAATPLKKIDLSFAQTGTTKTIEELESEYKQLLLQTNTAQKKLQAKLDLERIKLPHLIVSLENYRAQQETTAQLLKTKNFFVLNGYCEPKDVDALQQALPNATIMTNKPDEDTPTKLHEGKWSKHFAMITELFGLPGYGQVDPTPIIAFFFPFFFGFMLSDIGYGLLLGGIILALRMQYGKQLQTPFIIFGLSALSSIFFGLLFGSFFGNLVPVTPLYADSFSASYTILKIALVIGLIHLNLGIGLAIYQIKNKKGTLKDYLEPVSLLVLELTAIMFVLGLKPLGILFALLLVFMLIKAKGPFGLMDITGFFGTWFSYARLLALSLATAGVALAVNIIASKALGLGKLGILLWLLILIIGHLFNFALNILGCTIHAARLHYVEFFNLFFEPTGKKFIPFTLKKIYKK